MITTLIILLVILALIGVSLALGRTTREAQAVRDDEFVEIEGSWIRYRVSGEGPPVLLVHGLLGSSRIWDGLASRLSERFKVYTLDLRGFGESDKPLTGYGVRHGSRLLYSFCKRFRIGKAALVGHDIGGEMAVKLAADHPEFVRSVTLVATPANEEQIDLPTPLWLATLPIIGPLFYAIGQYVGPVRKLWLRPFVSNKRDLPEELVEDSAESTPAALRSTFNTVRREISRDRAVRQAQHLNAPLLLLAGEEDEIVDPQSVEAWSKAAPRSEAAILEGCGHLPMIELPEEFNARLFDFLTGEESRQNPRDPYGSRNTYQPPKRRRPESSESEDATDRVAPYIGETGGGIDGLEPDEEASVADRHSESAPEKDNTRDLGGFESSREDETGDLGYAARPRPRSDHSDAPARESREERKERGVWSEAEDNESDSGKDRRRVRRSNGERPNKLGEDLIPELSEDLFRWSDVERKRRRGRGEDPPKG